MNICFLARPCFDAFSTRIYNQLISSFDSAIEASFIVSNEKERNYVCKSVGEDASVYVVSKYFKKNWNNFTFDKFVEYEDKYHCKPIWKYIYTDRFLVNRDYDYCVKITVGYFMFFEDIFKNKTVDFYYDETIATLQSYVAYIVSKHFDTHYISQMPARGGLDSMYHYFLDDEFQLDMKLSKNYLNEIYSKEEISKAENFLYEFEHKDIKPNLMAYVDSIPHFKFKYLLLPLKYLKERNNKYLNDQYFYMYYQEYKNVWNPLKYYIRYQKSKKYYKKPDYSKKYVFYALHYEPEAATLVCAKKYEKQLYYIDSWAKSLPADTLLYVKEHYALLGNRKLSFYKDLQQYPNVVLVDPLENSRKLIEKAVAVTTLTGTVGWEAMLLRKPVFLGGRIFFENAPGVIQINDIFQNYCMNLDDWKKPKREEIIKYLCAFFRTLSEGNAYAASVDALSENNIYKITKSLYQEMLEIVKKEGEKNV